MPRLRPLRLRTAIALGLFALGASARADTEEQEAIQAQLASAMASADYAASHCPNLVVDRKKIDALAQRSGKSLAELKASEDYTEQRDVILEMAKGKQAPLICIVLPSAHGGYARGIISER